TAPLWTLLLAAGALLVGPSLALAKTLGVAATVVAGALTRRAALAWGAAPGVALAAGIALVWSSPLTWGALSGMEVSLAAALVERPWTFLRDWVRGLATTHWLLPIALTAALATAWRQRNRALAVPGLVLLAHPLAMALLAPYRGPEFQEGRYSLHLLPLALVV